jgi:hypothetical protein
MATIAMTATPLTTMAELGYSLEAQDVLERMGIHNARSCWPSTASASATCAAWATRFAKRSASRRKSWPACAPT